MEEKEQEGLNMDSAPGNMPPEKTPSQLKQNLPKGEVNPWNRNLMPPSQRHDYTYAREKNAGKKLEEALLNADNDKEIGLLPDGQQKQELKDQFALQEFTSTTNRMLKEDDEKKMKEWIQQNPVPAATLGLSEEDPYGTGGKSPAAYLKSKRKGKSPLKAYQFMNPLQAQQFGHKMYANPMATVGVEAGQIIGAKIQEFFQQREIEREKDRLQFEREAKDMQEEFQPLIQQLDSSSAIDEAEKNMLTQQWKQKFAELNKLKNQNPPGITAEQYAIDRAQLLSNAKNYSAAVANLQSAADSWKQAKADGLVSDGTPRQQRDLLESLSSGEGLNIAQTEDGKMIARKGLTIKNINGMPQLTGYTQGQKDELQQQYNQAVESGQVDQMQTSFDAWAANLLPPVGSEDWSALPEGDPRKGVMIPIEKLATGEGMPKFVPKDKGFGDNIDVAVDDLIGKALSSNDSYNMTSDQKWDVVKGRVNLLAGKMLEAAPVDTLRSIAADYMNLSYDEFQKALDNPKGLDGVRKWMQQPLEAAMREKFITDPNIAKADQQIANRRHQLALAEQRMNNAAATAAGKTLSTDQKLQDYRLNLMDAMSSNDPTKMANRIMPNGKRILGVELIPGKEGEEPRWWIRVEGNASQGNQFPTKEAAFQFLEQAMQGQNEENAADRAKKILEMYRSGGKVQANTGTASPTTKRGSGSRAKKKKQQNEARARGLQEESEEYYDELGSGPQRTWSDVGMAAAGAIPGIGGALGAKDIYDQASGNQEESLASMPASAAHTGADLYNAGTSALGNIGNVASAGGDALTGASKLGVLQKAAAALGPAATAISVGVAAKQAADEYNKMMYQNMTPEQREAFRNRKSGRAQTRARDLSPLKAEQPVYDNKSFRALARALAEKRGISYKQALGILRADMDAARQKDFKEKRYSAGDTGGTGYGSKYSKRPFSRQGQFAAPNLITSQDYGITDAEHEAGNRERHRQNEEWKKGMREKYGSRYYEPEEYEPLVGEKGFTKSQAAEEFMNPKNRKAAINYVGPERRKEIERERAIAAQAAKKAAARQQAEQRAAAQRRQAKLAELDKYVPGSSLKMDESTPGYDERATGITESKEYQPASDADWKRYTQGIKGNDLDAHSAVEHSMWRKGGGRYEPGVSAEYLDRYRDRDAAHRDYVGEQYPDEEYLEQGRYRDRGEYGAEGYKIQGDEHKHSIVGSRTQPYYERTGEGEYTTYQSPEGLVENVMDMFGYYDPKENPNPSIDAASRAETPEAREGKQYIEEWFNNPETRRRLKEHQGLTDKEIDQRLLHGLLAEDQSDQWKPGATAHAQYKPETHGYSLKSPDDSIRDLRRQLSQGGKYSPEQVDKFLRTNPEGKRYLQEARTGGAESLPHELVHATGLDVEVGGLAKRILGKQKSGAPNADYYSRPAEIYGNLFDIRRKLKLKPGQRLTPSEFKKLVKKYGVDKDDFYNNYEPMNMLKTLNTVAESDVLEDKAKIKSNNLKSLFGGGDETALA